MTLQEMLDQANRLARQRQWTQAGEAYGVFAEQAMRVGLSPQARWGWDAAGEACRRADRPGEAKVALDHALALAGSAEEEALARVKLAAVLFELGALDEMETQCRRVLEGGAGGLAEALASDSMVGLLLSRGRADDARELLDSMDSWIPEALRTGLAFRRAQIQHSEGLLREATGALFAVLEALGEEPTGEAGSAAAFAELGSIAMDRWDHREAALFFERAIECNEGAGRASLRFRAEAGRVGAIVELGAVPLVGGLEEGLAFAIERKLLVLEAELRLALGVVLAGATPDRAEEELGRVVTLGEYLRMPLLEARARVELVRRVAGPVGERRAALERGIALASGSQPWLARAHLTMGRLLVEGDPALARRHLAAALVRYRHMSAPGPVEAVLREMRALG